MPISNQERRCVEKTCDFLSSTNGGHWQIESYLDELHLREPTPEVTVTNGTTTAAIEVKRMTGSAAEQTYTESLPSNEKYLTPSCGGYYWISPPVDFRLPMGRVLRRQVKKEIERVAPSLKPGDSGVLRIPMSGYISLSSKRNPPWIHCSHGIGAYSDLFKPLIDRLNGQFMLVDEGLQHSFFTDEGKEEFYKAVVSACERRLAGDASTFFWNEEWQINRLREENEKRDGVWIVASTEVFRVIAAIEENLQSVLHNALKKFAKRWAKIHILVLEQRVSEFTDETKEVIEGYDPAMLPNIDYILLVTDDKVIQCYHNPG